MFWPEASLPALTAWAYMGMKGDEAGWSQSTESSKRLVRGNQSKHGSQYHELQRIEDKKS